MSCEAGAEGGMLMNGPMHQLYLTSMQEERGAAHSFLSEAFVLALVEAGLLELLRDVLVTNLPVAAKRQMTPPVDAVTIVLEQSARHISFLQAVLRHHSVTSAARRSAATERDRPSLHAAPTSTSTQATAASVDGASGKQHGPGELQGQGTLSLLEVLEAWTAAYGVSVDALRASMRPSRGGCTEDATVRELQRVRAAHGERARAFAEVLMVVYTVALQVSPTLLWPGSAHRPVPTCSACHNPAPACMLVVPACGGTAGPFAWTDYFSTLETA